MTVRITFMNKTEQAFTNIRLTTVYLKHGHSDPEIVLHGAEPQWGQTNIRLSDIHHITTEAF